MAFLFASKTTYDGMYELLNDVSEDERNLMTERWKDNKIQELNFVGIVVCLLISGILNPGMLSTSSSGCSAGERPHVHQLLAKLA
jgi:hypothetical protein